MRSMSQKVGAGKGRKRVRSSVGESSSSHSPTLVVEADEDLVDQQEEMTQGSSSTTGSRKYYNNMNASVRNEKVIALARYLLFSEGRKAPIKRKELIDKVVQEDSRAFPILLEKANCQLESLFGLKAIEIYRTVSKVHGRNLAPPPSGMSYVLVNTLPQELTVDLIKRSKADREEAGLLTVILSFIMMKQSISEDQLWNCLGRLGLSVENQHPTFGDLKRLITVDFVNQMYLNRDKVVVGDKYSISYRWGPRVEVQVNKEELFAFVAEIYEGNLEQWKRQFADIL